MFLGRLPGLLLIVALLVAVSICLKRIDFMLIDEVKAVVSIAFGFATSGLLLGLIWVLHRKPMHGTWPAVPNVDTVDRPNMHPRASIVSELLDDRDQPPDYRDALINSKPISWIMSVNKQEQKTSGQEFRFRRDCEGNVRGTTRSTDYNQYEQINSIYESRKISSPDDKTQLALSIVTGFTSASAPEQIAVSDSSIGIDRSCRYRKLSYCQLDVNQLMNQGSPPKYCEITMPRTDLPANNQSNEPTASSDPQQSAA